MTQWSRVQATSRTNAVAAAPVAVPARWRHTHLVVKEKRLTIGRQYRVFGGDDSLVGFCKQKMFRLKEDIRVYGDESRREEVLVLKATKVLDFNANFEVVDPTTGEHLGFLRRKGWSSVIRDAWQISDPQGNLVASVHEDSLGMALVRRLLVGFIPHKFMVRWGNDKEGPAAAEIHERFTLWANTYDVRVSDTRLDPRVLVGLTLVMDALAEAES